MSLSEKIFKQLQLAGADIASVGKAALRSRGGLRQQPVADDKEIFILGNGPSLRSAIDLFGASLAERELIAVNFFANTPDFATLQPQNYILADGHFFDGCHTDQNVGRLWRNLESIDRPMTLFVPQNRVNRVKEVYPGVVRGFNLTPIEGHTGLTAALIRAGLGMPRPRNVMIAAIMVAIWLGYKHIYLLGADHSWSKTLSVDSKNRVLSRQPHFYQDNEEELERVASEYQGYHLHDILQSLTVAFRSYHQILSYAETLGVEIINLTPDSMIDAFARATPTDLLAKQDNFQ